MVNLNEAFLIIVTTMSSKMVILVGFHENCYFENRNRVKTNDWNKMVYC